MGKGKTLLTTHLAKRYSIINPDSKIYSNYKLKLKSAIYSPFLIFPYTKLENCMLICDDFANLKNLDAFISIISSLSRKKDIEIILTAQYYSMIPLLIRSLSQLIEVNYYNRIDVLKIIITNCDGISKTKYIKEAVKKVKSLYDTKEVVKIPTDNAIIEELKSFNLSKEDLDMNLYFLFKNKNKIDKYSKILTKPIQ